MGAWVVYGASGGMQGALHVNSSKQGLHQGYVCFTTTREAARGGGGGMDTGGHAIDVTDMHLCTLQNTRTNEVTLCRASRPWRQP